LAIKDNAFTTLANELSIDGLSVVLTDGSSFPVSGPYIVTICYPSGEDTEKLLIDSRSSNTLTVNAAGRAYGGTTAAIHPALNYCFIGAVEELVTEIRAEIDLKVTGPASPTDGHVVAFDGATGKLVKDGGVLGTMAAQASSGYPAHALAEAENDFLVGAPTPFGTWVRKTLAQVKTILGLGSAAYTASGDYAVAGKGVTNGDSHDHAGGDGGQVDHGGLAGLGDDDHTIYVKHSLATAISDFLVASGAGAWVKKTLAEVKTILGLGTAAYTASGDYATAAQANANHSGDATGATALTIAVEAVTYAKMQHVSATDKLLGRSTAGAGDVEEIACTAAGRAILDDANAAAQLVTLGALPLAGGTMSGDITLGELTAIALDPDASADEKWSGITVTGTAGATLAVGDLCYLNSAWKWVLTDANAAATAGSVALGLCILAAAADNSATRMLLMGTMKSAAFPASITGGAQLYVSTTAGDMTTTQPTGVDDVIRVVGWAILTEPNTILFSPSSDFITRTA
jgi:hypothetical protein